MEKPLDKMGVFNKLLFSFIYWACSLLVFYGLIFVAKGNFATAPPFFVIILLLDIFFGIVCYSQLIFYSLKGNKGGLLGVSFIVIIFFFIILFKLPNLSSKNTSILGEDQFVACTVNEKCGGGTKQLRQNECANSTCCEVGRVWVVMDKDECKLKQQDYTNSQSQVAPRQIIQTAPIQIPQYIPPEPPLCCKESCNSFSGTCTTRCTKQWFCY